MPARSTPDRRYMNRPMSDQIGRPPEHVRNIRPRRHRRSIAGPYGELGFPTMSPPATVAGWTGRPRAMDLSAGTDWQPDRRNGGTSARVLSRSGASHGGVTRQHHPDVMSGLLSGRGTNQPLSAWSDRSVSLAGISWTVAVVTAATLGTGDRLAPDDCRSGVLFFDHQIGRHVHEQRIFR